MRLTLDALTAIEAIARKGSFAAAAAELHRVPSALSYTVQKLEQDLGVELFDRSGHRARLTVAGQALLDDGRGLLEAAAVLESRVKQVASGYEVELRIAVDDIIPMARVLPVLEEFYRERCGTQIKLLSEVYGGAWDALVSGRADLVIGAPGEAPARGDYATHPMGTVEFVFVVAPGHPLAEAPEPLAPKTILRHRAISVADSSRNLPPRTSGLLTGQEVLTVPDMATKVVAHRAGLGVGYLPRALAEREAADGRLRIKAVEEPKPRAQLFFAWRSGDRGMALAWFLTRLKDRALATRLLDEA